MSDATTTTQKLKELQNDLRRVADGIDLLLQIADRPLFDLATSGVASAGSTSSRLSPEAKKKISEANRNFWVRCPRPECNGVRHRRTHPHIVKSKKSARLMM